MKIEYATAKRTKITMEIVTETENLADHNFKNACYDLEVVVEGIGTLCPITLETESGLFAERCPRTINGKTVRVKFPSTPESIEFYNNYCMEVSRRADAVIKADIEYQEHYNKVMRAMA